MQDAFMGSGYTRRLPIYLLLDCSSSMAGNPISAVNEGLHNIHSMLMADPQALETVYMSLICFSDDAEQFALVAVDQFTPPNLTAGGARAMGAAFRLLATSIEQDLTLNTETTLGDYRPLVFLLIGGNPTDDYSAALNKLKALRGSRKPTIVALGCSGDIALDMLHEVTENAFLMHTVTPEGIRAFFKWISGSISYTPQEVGSSPNQTAAIEPPTFPGISSGQS